MIKVLYQILTEVTLICCYPVMSLMVLFIPKWELRGKGQGETIIIVERWLSINIQHLYWKYYLERKGYNVFLANFPLRLGNFDESAIHLKKYMQRNRITDATLVGISSGGLTALVYLQEYDGWNRVKKFISVGAPFRGTWVAIFLLWVRSGRELFPNSPFIQKLSRYKLLNINNTFCISASFDEMVPFGAVLPGSHHVKMKVVGHNNLHVQVRGTYRKIAEIVS